jgi:hypothetical protein
MAHQFEEMSGINPLSIDLVVMSERVDREHESNEYKTAILQYEIEQPTILINQTTGRPFLRNYTDEQTDLQVILSETKYTHGHSDWLSEGITRDIPLICPKHPAKLEICFR